MTTATVSAIDQARAIRREVMEAAKPQTREARWAIGWAMGELDGTLAIYDGLLKGNLDPYAVRAPDMGWWDDPERQALEYAADQALEAAEALRKRAAEYGTREDAANAKGEAA